MFQFNASQTHEIHPLFLELISEKPNPKKLEKIIDDGADVNMRHYDGRTPLHIAAHRGKLALVKLLLSKKADALAVNEAGFTPLHLAAQRNALEVIDALVAAGASVNAVSKVGCTPLHEASAAGHQKATIKLLELKADANLRDFRYNLTPANLAMQNGHVNVGKLLWERLNYQESFIQTIHFLLFNWKKNFSEKSLEKVFIQQLENELKTLKEADEVYKCVSTALQSKNFADIKDKLEDQKKILNGLMNKYRREKTAKTELKVESKQEKKIGQEMVDSCALVDDGKAKKTPEDKSPPALTFDFSGRSNVPGTSANLHSGIVAGNSLASAPKKKRKHKRKNKLNIFASY